MLLIALVAAAEVSAPLPINVDKWFYPDDTPQYLIDKGNGLWFVGVRLNVAADGNLQACEVESSSGIRPLDDLTCRLLEHRAKFKPARWYDGSLAYGVFRTSVKWAVADEPWDISKVVAGDMEISVDHLPAGVNSPALAKVMFAVDAAGHVSSCAGEPSGDLQRLGNDAALVPIACDQMIKNYRARPAKTTAGALIPSVQDGTVIFKADRR